MLDLFYRYCNNYFSFSFGFDYCRLKLQSDWADLNPELIELDCNRFNNIPRLYPP